MLKITLNANFIEGLQEEDSLRMLSVYVVLKAKFKNSCIYNSSYRNLSKVSGISITVLKKCIPFFKSKGWVREHSGNMVFVPIKSIDTFKDKILLTLKINKNEGYKTVLKKIKLLLLMSRHNRFEYVKKISRDYINPRNLKDYKKARRFVMKCKRFRPIDENTKFTILNRNFGKMIGRSKSTASRLIKWGDENGILKKKSKLSIAPHMGEYSFVRGGMMLSYRANQISF